MSTLSGHDRVILNSFVDYDRKIKRKDFIPSAERQAECWSNTRTTVLDELRSSTNTFQANRRHTGFKIRGEPQT